MNNAEAALHIIALRRIAARLKGEIQRNATQQLHAPSTEAEYHAVLWVLQEVDAGVEESWPINSQ